MSSSFSPAFLGGETRARAFLPDDFRDPARRLAQVRRAAARSVSSTTLEALTALSRRLGVSPAREAQLETLRSGRAAVVVTGQQVGLFSGPLYAFYKAASAIAVARALSAESGVPCVPVFWLQSEDHDFAEIDHCFVHARDGSVQRLSVAGPADSRRSVSSLELGSDVTRALDALTSALGGLPHADETLAVLRRHYRPEAGWVGAFASYFAEVFSDDGLLFCDPRDASLVAEARPVHQRALAECRAISSALEAREAALTAAGFAVQVNVRADVPLSFVHAEGFDGPRARPAAGTAVPAGAVCSSSALLRPIVQDTLLPTAAIVGGPGELNYFAQLPPLYEHFGLAMPMAVPRARFRVVDERTRKALAELGLPAAKLEVARAEVLASLVTDDGAPTPEAIEAGIVAAVEAELGRLPPDPRLGKAVERTRRTLARAASRLKGRYAFARAERDQVTAQRVDRVQASLWPTGAPQERVLCLPSMAARFGLQAFKASTLSKLEPFSTTVQELHP